MTTQNLLVLIKKSVLRLVVDDVVDNLVELQLAIVSKDVTLIIMAAKSHR